MSFSDRLRNATRKNKSIACFGIDPEIKRIPLEGSTHQKLVNFYVPILHEMERERTLPGMVKPNRAFFEQYGNEGIEALYRIISAAQELGLIVDLDAKRGDIGNTSNAYAKAMFNVDNVDALTVAPYMGSDSVGPFLNHCQQGKGVYLLVRTSNAGATDFQDLIVTGRYAYKKDDAGRIVDRWVEPVEQKPVYMAVAERLVEWAKNGVVWDKKSEEGKTWVVAGSLGAVVGATYPSELEEIAGFFAKSGVDVPLLIPGVGAQGGDEAVTVNAMVCANYELLIARINNSRALNYAYETEKNPNDFAGASVRALKRMNEKICIERFL